MGIYDRDYYQADELTPLRPWDNRSMVTTLIIVNAAVYIANFLFTAGSGALSNALALHADTILQPTRWWQFVTYGFTHDPDGLTHILFNMLSLYFLGRSVEEDRLGKWEFFRFYMLALLLGGLVWAGVHSGPMTLRGASGATTAVAMLFVYNFPQATLRLYFAIPVKAWVVGVLIVVGNLFTPMASTSEGPAIAYDVHLVGVAFATAYFFGKWNFGFLGEFYGNTRRTIKQKRRGLKVHSPDADDSASSTKDEQELDRILDKIYREGEESLTSRERKFMQRYSRRVRQRRGD